MDSSSAFRKPGAAGLWFGHVAVCSNPACPARQRQLSRRTQRKWRESPSADQVISEPLRMSGTSQRILKDGVGLGLSVTARRPYVHAMVLRNGPLADPRVDYVGSPLDETSMAPTWHEQLSSWLADAVQARLPEPTAMVLATADLDGRPSSRAVLCKAIDERGVVFCTNYTSKKSHDIFDTRYASVTFPWIALHRQAHLSGMAERVPAAETA